MSDDIQHAKKPTIRYVHDTALSERDMPPMQSNWSLANRLVYGCIESCTILNCDAQQAAHRLITRVYIEKPA